MKHWLITTLVSGAVALAAVPSLAQETGAPGVRSAPASKASRGDARASGERLESHLAQIKSKLQITAQQEPQWNAFADTLRKQARSAGERMKTRRAPGAAPAPMTAIQRLEQRKEYLAAAAARTDELLAAARPLYAALSAEQQKIADDLIAKRGGRRGGAAGDGQRGRG